MRMRVISRKSKPCGAGLRITGFPEKKSRDRDWSKDMGYEVKACRSYMPGEFIVYEQMSLPFFTTMI